MGLTQGERILGEVLIWIPTVILFVAFVFLNIPLLTPFEETNLALHLTCYNIHPETVFKTALERGNISTAYPYTLGMEDTELEYSYSINQAGNIVDGYHNQPASLETNGTLEVPYFYDDFPRKLIYYSSPHLLGESVTLEGPEDVELPTVDEKLIHQVFDKVLVLKNEKRVRLLKLFEIMVVIVVCAFIISIAVGGYGVAFLAVFILWIIWMSKSLGNGEIDKALKDAQLGRIFSQHHRKWGIGLGFTNLKHEEYNEEGGLLFVSAYGVTVAFLSILAQIHFYACN